MGLIVYFVMATVPSRKLAYILGHLVGIFFLVQGHWIEFTTGIALKRITFFLPSMYTIAKINIVLTNYYDGGKKDKSKFSSHEKRASSYMEDGPPSFSDYLNYLLFLPTAGGVGPIVEYYQTFDLLNRRGDIV